MKTENEKLVLFGSAAAQWRNLRGLSQRNLGAAIGHSQRHVSFLETGRAKPARETVERMVEVLNIPPRDGNRLLNLLGYQDTFEDSASSWTEQEAPLQAFRRLLLTGLHPYPAAIVTDGHRFSSINLVYAVWLSRFALDNVRKPESMFKGGMAHFPSLLFHPEGMKRHFANWDAFARRYLQAILRLQFHKPDAASQIISDIREIADIPRSWLVLDDQANLEKGLIWTVDTAMGEIRIRYLPFAVNTPDVLPVAQFPAFSIDLYRPADAGSEAKLRLLSRKLSVGDVHPLLKQTLIQQDPESSDDNSA